MPPSDPDPCPAADRLATTCLTRTHGTRLQRPRGDRPWPGRRGRTTRPNRCHVGICLARPLGNSRPLPCLSLPFPGRRGEGRPEQWPSLSAPERQVMTEASGLPNSIRIGRTGMQPAQPLISHSLFGLLPLLGPPPSLIPLSVSHAHPVSSSHWFSCPAPISVLYWQGLLMAPPFPHQN